MKKFLLAVVGLTLGAALTQAQEVRIGGHVGMHMQGNVEVESGGFSGDADLEDAFAFGAQLTHRANEAMSFELSATRFSTEFEDFGGSDFDVTSIAATLRLGGSPSEGVYIYGGGGGSYNIFDVDGSDMDDEFGYHFCGGIELPIDQTAQFFAEYRMTYITTEIDYGNDVDYEFGLLRVGVNFLL